jgi:hypothetical protein
MSELIIINYYLRHHFIENTTLLVLFAIERSVLNHFL